MIPSGLGFENLRPSYISWRQTPLHDLTNGASPTRPGGLGVCLRGQVWLTLVLWHYYSWHYLHLGLDRVLLP